MADAPCHGFECHDYLDETYPNGIPGQRNITDIVKDLAEKNISLFCMRITDITDKMFNMFENIYKNYKNIEFHVGDMDYTDQKFSNLIVDAATKVYVNQRGVDIK